MFDIDANRSARKWSHRELLGRVLWECFGAILFRYSPRQLWLFRRLVLRAFGARVGRRVHVNPSVKIAIPWNLRIDDDVAIGEGANLYSLGPIRIGRRATISQYAHLCAGSHDYRRATFDLLKPPIDIGADVWVCADAFIGPGISVGDRVIVAARAVVTKAVGEDLIVGGNPAQAIGRRDTVSAPAACTTPEFTSFR